MAKSSNSLESAYAHGERTSQTDDLRIKDVTPLPPPEHLIRFFPIAGTPVEQQIGATRGAIRRIMQREDDRLLVIMGPCSIHDPLAAVEYAKKLKRERDRFAGTLEIVMRVYFEKPRTTVGWKGLINDPVPRRELSHRRGPAHRPPAAARDQQARHAGGQRVPRRDLAAVPRRPDRLGRDRRAHHREPGAPRAGLGPVGADRLQERHRRQHPDRDRRDPGRRPAASLPLGAQERPGGDRRDPRQQGLPRHPARRQGAELRRRVDRRGLPRDRGREAAVHAHDRLQPCQQQQGPHPPGRRGARHRRPAGERQSLYLRRHGGKSSAARGAEVQRRQGRSGQARLWPEHHRRLPRLGRFGAACSKP